MPNPNTNTGNVQNTSVDHNPRVHGTVFHRRVQLCH